MANKPMTKSQVTAYFASKFKMPKKLVNEVMDEMACLAAAETKKNGVFVLPGIGKLVKSKRKARTGRNPATGEAIQIPAKTVIKMRLAKSCKDALES